MSFVIYPIGDAAATIEVGTVINATVNSKVIAMERWLRKYHSSACKEIVIAYSSLSVYYDLLQVKKLAGEKQPTFDYIRDLLARAWQESVVTDEEAKLVKIPVCYHPSLGLDLQYLCDEKCIDMQEVIRLHTSIAYRVYMVGFLPGFAYMGEVDEKIACPRKSSPRPQVAKGSVGIAGSQTGIYPLESPGGWQIIGRTPFRLFDPYADEIVPLHPGSQVQFSEISLDEFHQLNS